MKCPKCGSDECKLTTRLETHRSNKGWVNACCGYIILGPLGLLCGFCGNDTIIKEKEIWECRQCGARFTNFQGGIYDIFNSEDIGGGIWKIFDKLGIFAPILIIFVLIILAMLLY